MYDRHSSIREVKPLSHQTALPQRLYSVLKPYQRAVGSPRNAPKISKLSFGGNKQLFFALLEI